MVLNSIINGNPEIESHILGIPNVNRGYQFNLRCWVTPLVALLSQPDDIRRDKTDFPACVLCPGRKALSVLYWKFQNDNLFLFSTPGSFKTKFFLFPDLPCLIRCHHHCHHCAEPNTMFTSGEGFLSLKTLYRLTDWLTDWSWVFRVTLLVSSKQQYPVCNVLKLLQNILWLAGGPNTG